MYTHGEVVTLNEADAEMEPFYQAQVEAGKNLCCWKDNDKAAVNEWLKVALNYSSICYKYENCGQTEEEYNEEYISWLKLQTQFNCPVHSKEMEE